MDRPHGTNTLGLPVPTLLVPGRGGYCNFMHIKHVSRSLKKELVRNQKPPEDEESIQVVGMSEV